MTQYETNSRLERAERARELSARHADRPAETVLDSAIRRDFPGRIGLVSSFGTEAAVLLHMVSRIDPYVPVIFLDTWKHFPETLAYRDTLIAELGLCNIQSVLPRPASLAADDPGGDLHATNPRSLLPRPQDPADAGGAPQPRLLDHRAQARPGRDPRRADAVRDPGPLAEAQPAPRLDARRRFGLFRDP